MNGKTEKKEETLNIKEILTQTRKYNKNIDITFLKEWLKDKMNYETALNMPIQMIANLVDASYKIKDTIEKADNYEGLILGILDYKYSNYTKIKNLKSVIWWNPNHEPSLMEGSFMGSIESKSDFKYLPHGEYLKIKGTWVEREEKQPYFNIINLNRPKKTPPNMALNQLKLTDLSSLEDGTQSVAVKGYIYDIQSWAPIIGWEGGQPRFGDICPLLMHQKLVCKFRIRRKDNFYVEVNVPKQETGEVLVYPEKEYNGIKFALNKYPVTDKLSTDQKDDQLQRQIKIVENAVKTYKVLVVGQGFVSTDRDGKLAESNKQIIRNIRITPNLIYLIPGRPEDFVEEDQQQIPEDADEVYKFAKKLELQLIDMSSNDELYVENLEEDLGENGKILYDILENILERAYTSNNQRGEQIFLTGEDGTASSFTLTDDDGLKQIKNFYKIIKGEKPTKKAEKDKPKKKATKKTKPKPKKDETKEPQYSPYDVIFNEYPEEFKNWIDKELISILIDLDQLHNGEIPRKNFSEKFITDMSGVAFFIQGITKNSNIEIVKTEDGKLDYLDKEIIEKLFYYFNDPDKAIFKFDESTKSTESDEETLEEYKEKQTELENEINSTIKQLRGVLPNSPADQLTTVIINGNKAFQNIPRDVVINLINTFDQQQKEES